jgi:hypothetical protein
VRLDHLCEEFDFKNTGARMLTVDELESMQAIAPITPEGQRVWMKKNVNR